MRSCPAARAICLFSTLLWLGLFLNCGGSNNPTQSGGGAPTLTQISIAPSNPTITKGLSQQLTATGAFSDGSHRNLSASVTWQSNQSAVATIDTQGDVTGVGQGVAQVSATYQGVKGATSVTVAAAALVSVTVNPNQSSLPAGDSEQLAATGKFSDGTTQDVTQSVTWTSLGSAIASVSATGAATANAVGTTTISATSGSVTGSASLTVTPAALIALKVTPNQSSLPVGESEQLTASGKFTDGTTRDLTQSVTWLSLGTAIASVGPTGSATANGVGTATISATSGSLTASASLTVTPAAVIALNVNPATLSMGLGSSRQFQAIATLSDGTTQDLTGVAAWSSTQPAIANVSSGGLAIADQVGSTSIVAENSGITGSANLTVMPLIAVNYFDRASAEQAGTDATIRITNPGLNPGSLCTMVYVFDQNQELNECCGCPVSDSGLRTLSLTLDLTANPLTGKKPPTGVIKVLPSDITQNPLCDPGSITPTGVVLAWGSNVQLVPGGTFQITETKFEMSPLSDGEASGLVAQCTFVKQLGSGAGICSCGTGD